LKNKGGSPSGPEERFPFSLLTAANTSCVPTLMLIKWGTSKAVNCGVILLLCTPTDEK